MQAVINTYKTHVKSGFYPLPIAISRAKNATLWDVDGKEYIDFLTMFAVANMGHAHPRIVEACCKAIHECPLVNTALMSPSYAELAVKINDVFGYSRTVCLLAGADATEAAAKIARKWAHMKRGIKTNEAFILTTTACYHGLNSINNDNSGPVVSLLGAKSPSGVTVEYGDLQSLEEALKRDHATIAAFMVEPIQGSAGIVDPPRGYISGAYNLCKRYNVLFIADEVQTGMGRAGSLLKSFDDNIRPDLVCLGKGLGGGVAAIAAVIGSEEIMDILQYGDIGSTMAATPPATAAACAALDVLVEENICQMSREKGELLKSLLLEEGLDEIVHVSGDGVLRAAVLNPDLLDDKFNGARIVELCAVNGLIVSSSAKGSRIRLCPPPTIEESQLRKGIKIFAKCVREVKDVKDPIL
jgi:ornithine--oxo-acid transaminase